MHPHVPPLTTPPPSPHNRVQNKHVKIFHPFRVLYLCTVQRVLKTHWDSRRLDWTRLDRCEHSLTLESDWTGLDSTRPCWCIRSLTGITLSLLMDIIGRVAGAISVFGYSDARKTILVLPGKELQNLHLQPVFKLL